MPNPVVVAIERAVTSWPGVVAGLHRFGGREFRVGRRELGHLHGGRIADLPFPRRVRDALLGAGRAEAHQWLPDSGWTSFQLRGPEDVPAVIALFRLNYERPWLQPPAAPGAIDSHGGAT